MADEKTKKKDVWDKLDIIFKGLIAVGVAGGVALYTTYIENARRAEEAERRHAESLIGFVNARENAMSNLRAQMFSALMEHYFQKDDPKSKLTALELLALNFRDSVQIKPLFQQLDDELSNNSPKMKRALRSAAKRIVQDQLKQIEMADGSVCELRITLSKDQTDTPDCAPFVAIGLRKIVDGSVFIETSFLQAELFGGGKKTFSVTHFDMPMTDYTILRMRDNLTAYSLALISTNSKNNEATIALAVLPSSSLNRQNSHLFDQALARLLLPAAKQSQ